MPPKINPSENYLLDKINMLEKQVRKLAQQQQTTVANSAGQTILNFGLLPALTSAQTSQQYGLQMLNPGGNVPIVQLGQQADGTYGLDIFDYLGNLRMQMGLLSNGDYGVSVVDTLGTTHELNPLYYTPASTTSYSTASSAYTNLSFPTLSVPIGKSGSALLTASANCNTSVTGQTALVGLSVDGASPSTYFVAAGSSDAIVSVTAAAQYVETGISEATHTFSLWFASSISGDTATFDQVTLTVWPI